MSEWKEYKLGDITDWFSGGTPSKQNESYWNGKIPWISARSLNGTKVSESEIKITQVGLENGSRLAIEDDILLLVRGSGLFNSIPVAIVEKPVAFNQDIKAIRLKKEFKYISPWFILFWFYSNTRTLYSIMEETGIGAGKFDTNQLKALTIKIPDEKVLNEITKTFKSLDSKITLLRQQNHTLKELAQTLFKRWFVDFEFPNENGKPYKSSGGKMIDSELGEIPEGWRVGKLSEIIKNHDSKRVPLSSNERLSRKGKYPYHGATSIMDYVDNYIFDGRFVLLGEDGSVIDEEGFPILQFVDGKFWVNNHAHVLEGNDVFSTNYIYLLLRRTNISHIVTGAVQLKINQGNLNGISIIIGVNKILQKFNELINPFFNQYFLNKNEIQLFTKLRDTLLPKLMRGDLTINQN